ncbi:MAG: FMN-binding protein [Eubacterium sp.]|nr:FMN-binding protein [Eubacterium sp.]
MGMMFGCICLVCFCLLAAKAVTHRCRWEKADRLLLKIHRIVSIVFVISCAIHVVCIIPVLQTRSIAVTATGIAGALILLFLICLCHVIKDGEKKMWWHRVLTLILALCISGHIVAYIVDFKQYQQKVNQIAFEEMELVNIADGTYEGEYDAGYIYAKVEVQIKNHEILAINILEHLNERGEPAEKLLDDIVEMQNIYVDTVSGATNSSNVLKKAVENALMGE